MSVIKLIISDIHLGDGHAILDGFGDQQQSALEGLLLAASPGGPLGQAEDVELIINGDCFDFLVTPPYNSYGTTDSTTALSKLEKIISAHQPFFTTLRQFIGLPGRHVTFITGNHDIELRFGAVRARISEAIGGKENVTGIYFCPTRYYRPLPDIYIEHGNHYDFWNHCVEGVWDATGRFVEPASESFKLPVGSYYMHAAAMPISIGYSYFDHFDPPMNSTRQIALLCLLNPDMVVQTARHTMEMRNQIAGLDGTRKALANLAPGEQYIPDRLFSEAMIDFAAFQQDMLAYKTDWVEAGGPESEKAQVDAMMEFALLREALTLPRLEAVAAICTPAIYAMDQSVTHGMHQVLVNDPALRYAIAGHTHLVRIDPVNNGKQVYLNTSSWTTHIAPPVPGEVTPELVEWLQQPDPKTTPLPDVSARVFALINATDGSPASGSLCVWEGGIQGNYRVLA